MDLVTKEKITKYLSKKLGSEFLDFNYTLNELNLKVKIMDDIYLWVLRVEIVEKEKLLWSLKVGKNEFDKLYTLFSNNALNNFYPLDDQNIEICYEYGKTINTGKSVYIIDYEDNLSDCVFCLELKNINKYFHELIKIFNLYIVIFLTF